jgi:hypothetical protein
MSDLRDTAVKGNFVLRYTHNKMTWSTDPDVKKYFSDMDDQPLGPSELYLDSHAGNPLPDIVCRASDRLVLRTRFHPAPGNKLEHEVLVESPGQRASAD